MIRKSSSCVLLNITSIVAGQLTHQIALSSLNLKILLLLESPSAKLLALPHSPLLIPPYLLHLWISISLAWTFFLNLTCISNYLPNTAVLVSNRHLKCNISTAKPLASIIPNLCPPAGFLFSSKRSGSKPRDQPRLLFLSHVHHLHQHLLLALLSKHAQHLTISICLCLPPP